MFCVQFKEGSSSPGLVPQYDFILPTSQRQWFVTHSFSIPSASLSITFWFSPFWHEHFTPQDGGGRLTLSHTHPLILCFPFFLYNLSLSLYHNFGKINILYLCYCTFHDHVTAFPTEPCAVPILLFILVHFFSLRVNNCPS